VGWNESSSTLVAIKSRLESQLSRMNCQKFSPFDKLRRGEFGAFGRQRDDADVGRRFQLVGHVPSRLIHQRHGVGTRGVVGM
jgi:hypothetical protein